MQAYNKNGCKVDSTWGLSIGPLLPLQIKITMKMWLFSHQTRGKDVLNLSAV